MSTEHSYEYNLGYQAGILEAMRIIIAQANGQLDQVIAELKERNAA